MLIDRSLDNEMLKLSEVVEELKIPLGGTFWSIAKESRCSVFKMLVSNCTKTAKKYYLLDGRDVCPLPDKWVCKDYIPVNVHTLNDIRETGKYSTTAHEITIPDEEGYVIEIYIPGQEGNRVEGMRIEATLDTLYLSAYHAKVLRERLKIAEPVPGVSSQNNHNKALLVDGQAQLEAYFDPVSWNTIKLWLTANGVPKPAKGEKWRCPLLLAIGIKTKKASFIRTKKEKEK